MRILLILSFFSSVLFCNAQESFQSNIEYGRFYGIFPVAGNQVLYAGSISCNGSASRDSIYEKAKIYFGKNKEAKFQFVSANKDSGEVLYQGLLNSGAFSSKSDLRFNISIYFKEKVCLLNLYQIMISPTEAKSGFSFNGGAGSASLNSGSADSAGPIENIVPDKGEFSRRYCQKIDQRFLTIIAGLKSACSEDR